MDDADWLCELIKKKQLVTLGGEHRLDCANDDHIQAQVLFVIDQALADK